MYQTAPTPTLLSELVEHLTYKPGWTFTLANVDRGQGSTGLTLTITTLTVDSYHHEVTNRRVHHLFIVPAAAYDARSWRRWLLDRLLDVESHECCEFFTLYGDKPYAPSHGPGNDPYLIREVGTDVDQRTSFRGAVKGLPDA